mmetsp:Transcript_68109/g.142262  ORF Transcript_68109/g.142262 Transcript_68109/m.142262 type:complete len:474 (-) Transcript_68109:324-1745(-)|eukprot:CAMPEP_0206451902 /NCGR_PEP_ID=MMETSP0324_2-20121206/19621_1 /ASSEMBLY_ACC=CAM_ASM_000836 /TAXON_ID=2866 /ORGANISM="Crypthecodinium cohnii, Strain Seligo" /LENGTH=473 /DNA_ID=CAMNT_0053921879 /DNA_START=95 /DNA_END=1516 /DNA_ORIENTATION=+
MGVKGSCNGMFSKEDKDKMALKVKKALAAKKAALGNKAAKVDWPEGCMEGTYARPCWLPAGWLHGVKVGTFGHSGRGLQVFVSPDRTRRFYHRVSIEAYLGRKLTREDGEPPSFDELLANAFHKVPTVQFNPKHEQDFFKCLDDDEKAALPPASDIHFCVISARRTRTSLGIKGCMVVHESLKAGGVKAKWYVDKGSLEQYRRLGFDAVEDGGSLCAARNKALKEARKLNKACCEISDDISRWVYYGALEKTVIKDESEANRLTKRCRKLQVSPVAAARFLLARLRAAQQRNVQHDGKNVTGGPKLAGVLPTGNVARGIRFPAVTHSNFILGDFFVVDVKSTVDFDSKLTLKEDYDFTCSHLQKYGEVLRCNRMILDVAHYSNAGGAVSIRNAAEEQKNIATLVKKWGISTIRKHPTRENEVMLHWPLKKQKAATAAKISAKKDSKAGSKSGHSSSSSGGSPRKVIKTGKLKK